MLSRDFVMRIKLASKYSGDLGEKLKIFLAKTNGSTNTSKFFGCLMMIWGKFFVSGAELNSQVTKSPSQPGRRTTPK